MIGITNRNELPPAVARAFDKMLGSLRAFLEKSFDDQGHLLVATTATVSGVGFPIGTIVATGRSTAPAGWLLCDGSVVSRTTYADLFSAIGILYGAGNGSTTFNIPNLQGRFPLGKATAGTGSTLGSTGGAIDHTHSGPSHTHTIGVPSATTAVQSGAGSTVASATHTHTADAAGAGNTGTANPPYQVVNWLILAQ